MGWGWPDEVQVDMSVLTSKILLIVVIEADSNVLIAR